MKTQISQKTLAILLAAFFWLCGFEANAQNIGINGTGGNAHPSALLDIDAVATPSLGVLIPRIALQAVNLAAPVSSPATSLLLYNTASASSGTNAVSPGYYYWDGAKWVRFNTGATASAGWDLLGNAGTVAGTNFLGTTDAQDLVFRTNNTEKIRILSNGNVGIGTNSPLGKLDVFTGGVASWDRMVVKTTSFWGDGTATASETAGTQYVTIGAQASGIMLSNPHVVWNASSGAAAIRYGRSGGVSTGDWWEAGVNASSGFHIRKTAAAATGIEIIANGNVGIGTTAPGFKLHVPSGYIGTDYINTSDNAVTAGVTGIMVKQGDNFYRTANAAAINAFLGITAPTGDNLGNHTATTTLNMNANYIDLAQGSSRFAQSNNTTTDYANAPIQIREAQYAGVIGAKAPRLSFHWGGVAASQISVESSGRISILNNPGTGYENFVANEVFSNQWFRNINAGTGLYNQTTGAGIYSPSTSVMAIYPPTSNLGIGTATPTEKLEVQGSVKIVDGTQGAGKVLGSDAAGKASWVTLSPTAIPGSIPSSDLNFTVDGAYHYIGYSVVVPPGRCNVSVGVFAQCPTMDYFTCQLSISNTVSTFGGGSYLPGLCAVACNPNTGTGIGSLLYYVNNTSGSPMTLYVWGIPAGAIGGNNCLIRGSLSAAEPYILSAY